MMRELKMADLKVEAPLATIDSDDSNDFADFQASNDKEPLLQVKALSNLKAENNYGDNMSGSLEDLVNNLDDKIINCFSNYEENVDKIAPVQIRSQEEIMNDCQMWWTITGNYGNILPIDWSNSYVKKLHTKSLNLREKSECDIDDYRLDLSDDEELSQAFDMHSLIMSSMDTRDPVVTADQVINEIELMMQEDSDREDILLEEIQMEPTPCSYSSGTILKLPMYSQPELKSMSLGELNDVLSEYEKTVKDLSETLVYELALRDELEYNKELKNQFISLLLLIQKRRRECNADKKRKKPVKQCEAASPDGVNTGQYLTTVIPYQPELGAPDAERLQIYIKILEAIKEDSSTVPSLLTDYILKVLCPT